MSTTARNLTIKNDGSTTIPPRGAVEVTTATRQTDGTLVYSVRRPTDPIGGTILFNHRSPVAANQWGTASDRPVEQGLTTGVAGDEVGPVNGSYELQPSAAIKTHRVVAVLNPADKLASLERLGGGGGGGGCPQGIEVNTSGGLHFRINCGGAVSAWKTIPAVVCEEGGAVVLTTVEP
jgi:hypothetical protein